MNQELEVLFRRELLRAQEMGDRAAADRFRRKLKSICIRQGAPATSDWLRSDATTAIAVGGSAPPRIDVEKKVIRGYVVAQRGPFKTPGRGEFDDDSLKAIVELMNRSGMGTKARFAHPDMSNDGLGKFLGRARNARVEGNSVRADLYLSQAAFESPSGNLGKYVMDLAREDPWAFGSSLVLQTQKEYRLAPDGTRMKDKKGKELPPLWRPTKIHASDIVDDGDAVHDGFLGSLRYVVGDELLRELVDTNQPREHVEAKLLAMLEDYLDVRYGHRPN